VIIEGADPLGNRAVEPAYLLDVLVVVHLSDFSQRNVVSPELPGWETSFAPASDQEVNGSRFVRRRRVCGDPAGEHRVCRRQSAEPLRNAMRGTSAASTTCSSG
jgi:hypothetical protein